MITTAMGSSSAATGALGAKKKGLQTEDFIKMMVTQLQNQDPLEPAKNEALLAQMSQISQLQSTTTLTDSLKGMVLQNQIGSAAGLIGKSIEGMDENNETVTGLVTSVRVEAGAAKLELDNGQMLPLDRVTSIAPTTGTATTLPEE